MQEAERDPTAEPGPQDSVPWLAWLGWGWVVLLFLAVLAEVSGWENLRLALDFQRHFR